MLTVKVNDIAFCSGDISRSKHLSGIIGGVPPNRDDNIFSVNSCGKLVRMCTLSRTKANTNEKDTQQWRTEKENCAWQLKIYEGKEQWDSAVHTYVNEWL